MSLSLRKIKEELVVLLILVPLAVVFGLVLWQWPSDIEEKGKEALVVPSVSQVQEVDDKTAAENPSTKYVPPKERLIEQQEHVSLVISRGEETKEYQIQIKDEATVEEVLDLASEQEGLVIDKVNYGGELGVLVTGLGGIANNEQKNHYWYFYVNGELSQVGVSNTVVRAGDKVEWRYEENKNYDVE